MVLLTDCSSDLSCWREPSYNSLSIPLMGPVLIALFTAAHTVVIKGVKVFQNNATKEYSDLDVMQMMGRAGRPQFGNLICLASKT
jgi:hypothetical protein